MLRRYLFVVVPAVGLFLACGNDDDPAANPADAGVSSSGTSGASGSSGSSGSSGTSGTGTSSGTPGTTDCASAAAALCDYAKRCLSGLVEESTCVKQETALCAYQLTLADYAKTPLPQSCIDDGYKNAACTGIQTPAAFTKDECIPKGTKELTAGCDSDGQCASGNCYGKTSAQCGQCADFALDGADCTKAKCKPGLACASGKCKPYDALGAACTIGSCAFPNKCVGSKCTAPLADGADCTHPATDESPCEKSCLQDTMKCGPSPNVFVKAGEACEGVSRICPAGTKCFGPAGNKTCVLNAGKDEACNDDTGPRCAEQFACDGTTCIDRERCK